MPEQVRRIFYDSADGQNRGLEERSEITVETTSKSRIWYNFLSPCCGSSEHMTIAVPEARFASSTNSRSNVSGPGAAYLLVQVSLVGVLNSPEGGAGQSRLDQFDASYMCKLMNQNVEAKRSDPIVRTDQGVTEIGSQHDTNFNRASAHYYGRHRHANSAPVI